MAPMAVHVPVTASGSSAPAAVRRPSAASESRRKMPRRGYRADVLDGFARHVEGRHERDQERGHTEEAGGHLVARGEAEHERDEDHGDRPQHGEREVAG